MKILVLNSGSSSIKFKLFEMKTTTELAGGVIEQIGESNSHKEGLKIAVDTLIKEGVLHSFEELDGIGHRVVHGGEKFSKSTIINKEVTDTIKELIPLAPLHNPANLTGIESAIEHAPDVPNVAVFDTAFHQSMPKSSYMYALPYELYKNKHVRRYGFHGTSHLYVLKKSADILHRNVSKCNFITLHLGNGASACAIKNGKSYDTSMGFTPLEGLIMGTRCGDLDPAIVFYLENEADLSTKEVDKLLNKQSGLKGICGINDLREIEEKASSGDAKAKLAIEMMVTRIKKYVGAYAALLGRVDAIIFTGGIGEHSKLIRKLVCEGLDESIGAEIDLKKNEENEMIISKDGSNIAILVTPTNEELEIANQTVEVINGGK
jgi:acetate kinase